MMILMDTVLLIVMIQMGVAENYRIILLLWLS